MPRGIPNKREDMTRDKQKRVPAGMPRQKLKVEGMDPNKKYYWATESQFAEMEGAGYSFVTNNEGLEVGQDQKIDHGSRVSRPASRFEDSKLYLMQIDKKWHKENQKEKQDAIENTERQILNRGDTETTYSAKGNARATEILK